MSCQVDPRVSSRIQLNVGLHIFFFLTVALTGIGSAYYHLEPNNDRLVWDRLPLAMMFMALFHHRGAFESVCGYLAFFASRHPKRSNRVLLALV